MKQAAVIAFAALLAACASSKAPDITQPDITLIQTSSVPNVAQYQTGGVPINYRLTVKNNANIPITLKKVYVQSVGTGGYALFPTSRPFNQTVNPNESATVEFWAPADAQGLNVAGTNSPVVVRVTTTFDTAQGSFQNIATAEVAGNYGT